ncbi:MAG: helix-turn-helix transcriptional regulator [Prevotella sp.]|nr:helix-turn-helix transcriptional regulator [Prevotella sp.]
MKDKETILKIFGKNVQLCREKAGISQEKLAELADVHRTYIGTVERGETNITLYNIYKLAQALNVNIKELL